MTAICFRFQVQPKWPTPTPLNQGINFDVPKDNISVQLPYTKVPYANSLPALYMRNQLYRLASKDWPAGELEFSSSPPLRLKE